MIIPCEYSCHEPGFYAQREEYEEYFRITKNGKKGIINIEGNVLVPFEYDYMDCYVDAGVYASPYDSKTFLIVKKDKKWGVINLENEILLPFDYDCISYLDIYAGGWAGMESGFLKIEKNGKVGVAKIFKDTVLRLVHDCMFEDVRIINEFGEIEVKISNRWQQMPNENSYYTIENGVFFNKDKTILIECVLYKHGGDYIIPDSVTEIGESAFVLCGELTSVAIPNSVTKISDYVFCGCRLPSIMIPASVVEIGRDAFLEHWAANSPIFVSVDPDNPVFTNENGKLKRKDNL